MASLVTLAQVKWQLYIPQATTDQDVDLQDLADRASAMVITHLKSQAVAGWSTGTVVVPGGIQTATLTLIAELHVHRGDEEAIDSGWQRLLIPFRDPALA
jgi:hypothetical protein